MSTKSTIFQTNRNEDCFHCTSDNSINLDIHVTTANIREDGEFHFIELLDPTSQIYKLFELIQDNEVIREEIKKHIKDFI